MFQNSVGLEIVLRSFYKTAAAHFGRHRAVLNMVTNATGESVHSKRPKWRAKIVRSPVQPFQAAHGRQFEAARPNGMQLHVIRQLSSRFIRSLATAPNCGYLRQCGRLIPAMCVGLFSLYFAAPGNGGESNSKNVNWDSLMPAVRSALQKQPPHEGAGERDTPGILRRGHIADLTGTAFLKRSYGGTGRASTSELALMRIENDKPVVALFKGRQGKTEPIVFLGGASVRHSDSTDLLPRRHALFHLHFEYTADGRLGPGARVKRIRGIRTPEQLIMIPGSAES